MSATTGTLDARTISLSARVESSSGQDTRTMSTPASSQRRIWSIVAFASAVEVLVIVWTVIGESPPTGTAPRRQLRPKMPPNELDRRTGQACGTRGLRPARSCSDSAMRQFYFAEQTTH